MNQDYIILREFTMYALEDLVRRHMGYGYKPQGGVTVANVPSMVEHHGNTIHMGPDQVVFLQAVVWAGKKERG